MREIWILQYRFPKRFGYRPFKLLEHPRFRAAYDFLLLRAHCKETDSELAEWWTEVQTLSLRAQREAFSLERQRSSKRRRASRQERKPRASQ